MKTQQLINEAVAKRRLSAIKSGSVKPVPGKEVFEKIWRKFEQ